MSTKEQPPQVVEYCCPGGRHPITRAVHLGRLSAFYPACRQCSHRDDTGTLSPRQVEQLAESSRGQPKALFHDEGAGGVYLNDLTPAAAQNIAAAFGVVMRDEGRGARGEGRSEEWKVESGESSVQHSAFIVQHSSLVLAGDGRPITTELNAAVSEGLRWSGCDVIDIGPATSACLAFAVRHLQAAGGILVGNPGSAPHVVGLQFWAAGPRPLSAGGSLEPIAERYHTGVDRPARTFGTLRRFQADVPYLAAIAPYYHAMRPLRVVVDSASKPLVDYLQKLTAAVACQVIPCRVTRQELPEQIRADAAHLAVCLDGDGETCRVVDQQGRFLPTERLLLLLAQHSRVPRLACPTVPSALLDKPAVAPGSATIVLEDSTPGWIGRRIEQLGGRVAPSAARRADMAAAMREHNALLGGGPSGRFWYANLGLPLPDVLMTITHLLAVLSRSDEPLSTVLDRDAPLG